VATIDLVFTDAANAPFDFTYTINGGSDIFVYDASSTYGLIFDGATLGGDGVYNILITDIWDNTGAQGIVRSPSMVTITVLPTPEDDITGSIDVGTNTTSAYATSATNTDSYSWSLNNGLGSVNNSTTRTPTVDWGASAGFSTLSVIKTSLEGCITTGSVDIDISLSPQPDIQGPASVCAGSTQTYYVTNNTGHTYSWTVTSGGAIQGSNTGSSISVLWGSAANNEMVTVVETDGVSGFSGTDDLEVDIGFVPQSNRTVNVINPTICISASSIIRIQNSENNVAYQLRNNDDDSNVGSYVGGNNGAIDFVVSPTTTTTYNILAYTSAPFSCQVELTGTYTVTVTTPPAIPTASVTAQPTCAVPTGTITVTAPIGAAYEYAIDGGTYQAGTSFALLSPGNHTVTARLAASTTCVSGATANILVAAVPTAPAIPTASVTAQPTCAVPTGTITVTAPIGAAYEYAIDAGTYQAGTSFALLSPGNHTVTARLAASTTCVSGATANILVAAVPTAPAIPTASVTAQPTCAVPTGTITVTAPIGAAYEYAIDGGTYQAGTSFALLSPGNHTVTARLAASTTCVSAPTEIITVDVVPSGCDLVADFSADKTEACPGEDIVFTSNSEGVNSATSYQWNFGEGAVPETETGIGPHTVTYTTAGSKTVSLIISNGFADDTVRTDYIVVHEVPSVSLENVYRCGAGEVVFNAVSANAQQVEFSTDALGNNIVSTDVTGPEFTFSTDIDESLSLQIWARAVNTVTGCAGTWDSSAFAISHPIPLAGQIQTSNMNTIVLPDGYVDAVCIGEKRTYSVNDPSAIYNWRITDWRGNGLDTTIIDTVRIDITWSVTGGDYTIELVKISAQGCSSLVRDTMVLVSQPIADLGENVSICEGESHTFELEEGYSSYTWQGNPGTNTFTASTTGEITVSVLDAYGCEAADTVMMTMNPNPVIFLGKDTSLCGENYITLDPGDFDSYDWSTNAITRTVEVREGAGNISVTVTDENGCQGYDEIRIGECSMLLQVPNAFTPNEDVYHDKWEIPGIELFSAADIKVFDRWGRLVFSSNGVYSGNEWDGKGPNGKDLPVDTYYYIIDLKVPGGELLSGTVDIIR
jgi:gliding motility-associated-like protein